MGDLMIFYGSGKLPKARCLSKVPNARVVRGDARKEGLLQEARCGAATVLKNGREEKLIFDFIRTFRLR